MIVKNEVRAALETNQPVVALESTVIAHGLPRPHNLDTAQRLERIVRERDAVPATIAMLAGQLRVGLEASELELLAGENEVKKLSVRDLPIAAARGWTGATTVASTLWIAHRAGIKVFATGASAAFIADHCRTSRPTYPSSRGRR